MKDRLDELLFHNQVLILLAEYDPDRVFKFIQNSCVLFDTDVSIVQSVLVQLLSSRREHSSVRKEAIMILHRFGLSPKLISDALKLYDKDYHMIYNVRRYPVTIQDTELTELQRTTVGKLFHQLRHMGELL